jgi:hypothetical protein
MTSSIHTERDAVPVDFNHLLRDNLARVFNERDADARAAAIAELYAVDPIMYEPDAIIEGRATISNVAGNCSSGSDPISGSPPKPTASDITASVRCAGMQAQAPRRRW